MKRIVVLVSVVLAMSLPVGGAQAASPAFSPGAAGAGDSYYPLDGNAGYDVSQYLLDIRYDPDSDHLTGVATIAAMATQNLSSFNLDLDGLTVTAVTVDARPATWTRDAGELTVTPARGILDHTSFITVVHYDGVPETLPDFGTSGFIHTDDGALVVGQPHVAATWFPSNDHPSDTAAFTFLLTVPDGLEAIANGTLEGVSSHDGWTTWEWRAKDAMATYLAGTAIGQFEFRAWRDDGLRFWDAIDPELFTPDWEGLGDIASEALSHQSQIINFLEPSFGDYPFKVAGGIVDAFPLRFALENQTRPIYSPFFFFDPIVGDFVIVHELAHQWYGDSLTVENWRDIWLNEGFATYAEWLWAEGQDFGTPQDAFDFLYNDIPADDPFWQVVIGDPSAEFLFDDAVYVRGAMTLQQLRVAVGDDDFFQILRRWAHDYAGKNVTTDQFIALAERISGQELADLFDTWLFTAGKPELSASALKTSASVESPMSRNLLERFRHPSAIPHS